MVFTAVIGSSTRAVVDELFVRASEFLPALVIDCCNSANPYLYVNTLGEEALMNLYVVEAESLYRFKPCIERFPLLASEFGARTLVITPIRHLFDFGNKEEYQEVLKHSWKKLFKHKDSYNIFIGCLTKEQWRAQKYCDQVVWVG